MTLSREEYTARAVDAYLEKRWGTFGALVPPEVRVEALERISAALDAVGAYETYEALGETLQAVGDLDDDAAYKRASFRGYAAISRAEGWR